MSNNESVVTEVKSNTLAVQFWFVSEKEEKGGRKSEKARPFLLCYVNNYQLNIMQPNTKPISRPKGNYNSTHQYLSETQKTEHYGLYFCTPAILVPRTTTYCGIYSEQVDSSAHLCSVIFSSLYLVKGHPHCSSVPLSFNILQPTDHTEKNTLSFRSQH